VNIDSIREEVFRLRPKFAQLVQTWGDKTLLEYYTKGFSPTSSPSDDVLDTIASEVASILGEEVATNTRYTVAKQKWVNTADHHGLLHHPCFYTTSLALSCKEVCDDASATVALPFGGVSLGNDSFPRGFSFHDKNLNLQKIFFKSLKYRRLPIYALEPMTQSELIHEKLRSTSLSLTDNAAKQLQNFFDALLADPRVWSQETYSAQLTVMNSILWHQLFGEERGDFVYLEIESVVRRLLLKKHLRTETPIFNLIFKREWREKYVELFNGIQGAHDVDSGTNLFWYIDHASLTRRRLIISGGSLIIPDGSTVIPITKEAIAEGLENRTLMPSSALTLITIQEVENLTCGGGPSQLQYLSSFETKWADLLQHFGETSTARKPAIWCGDSNLFSITDTEGLLIEQATLLDVLLYTKDPSLLVDSSLTNTKISSVIDAMIPALFSIYTHQKVPAQTNCTTATIVIR
jgi:hypothetical protein